MFCGKCGSKVEEDMKFCAVCGEPVNVTGGTGQPSPSRQKPNGNPGSKAKIVIPIVVGVLVIGVAVILGLAKQGVFLSKNDKVLLAISNSLKGSHLAKDLSPIWNLTEDHHSVTVEYENNDEDLVLNGGYTLDGKNLTIFFEGEEDSDKTNIELGWIDGVLEATSSETDKVLTYNYKADNDGEAVNAILEDFWEDDKKSFDSILERMDERESSSNVGEDVKNVLYDTFRSAEVSYVGKDSYNVGGKKRTCKGYRMELSDDELRDMADELKQICEDSLKPVFVSDEYAKEEFDDIWDEISEVLDRQEVKLTCYIYKNTLAYMCVDVGVAELELTLEGEAYPLENSTLEMKCDGEKMELVSTSGKTEDGEERLEINVMDEEPAEMTYDYKNGKFEFEVDDYYWEADVKTGSDSVEINLEGDEIDRMAFGVSKGGRVKDLEGEKVDFGSLDEDEAEELLADVLGGNSYMTKSRISTDIQTGQTIACAIQTALSNENSYDVAPFADHEEFPTSLDETPADEYEFWKEVDNCLGGLDGIKAKAKKLPDGTTIDPVFYYSLEKEVNMVKIYIGTYELYPNVDEALTE